MEVVDYQNALGGGWVVEGAERLRGETFATLVQCCYLEAIQFAWLHLELVLMSLHDGAIVKSASSFRLVNDVRGGSG